MSKSLKFWSIHWQVTRDWFGSWIYVLNFRTNSKIDIDWCQDYDDNEQILSNGTYLKSFLAFVNFIALISQLLIAHEIATSLNHFIPLGLHAAKKRNSSHHRSRLVAVILQESIRRDCLKLRQMLVCRDCMRIDLVGDAVLAYQFKVNRCLFVQVMSYIRVMLFDSLMHCWMIAQGREGWFDLMVPSDRGLIGFFAHRGPENL